MPDWEMIRLRAWHKWPYLSHAIMGLTLIETKEVPTMGVDNHLRLYWNPEWVAGNTKDELVAVYLHEVCHVVLNHAERVGSRDKSQWNAAGDLEINDDLVREGLSLPGGPLLPASFGYPTGLPAEDYYERLEKDGKCQEKGGQPGGGDCGTCATGGSDGHELAGDDPRAPDLNEVDRKILADKLAREIQQHQKERGNVPGAFTRWAGEILGTSKVPWQRRLSQAVRREAGLIAGNVDYTFRKFSRRSITLGGGIRMPGMAAPKVEALICQDTSGSMSDSDIEAGLIETNAVIKAVGGEIGYLAVDSQVSGCVRTTNIRECMKKLSGGGGTDMRVGIEAGLRCTPKPQIIIVMTDGYTPWPAVAPHGVKVIAVITPGGNTDSTPEWMTEITVD